MAESNVNALREQKKDRARWAALKASGKLMFHCALCGRPMPGAKLFELACPRHP